MVSSSERKTRKAYCSKKLKLYKRLMNITGLHKKMTRKQKRADIKKAQEQCMSHKPQAMFLRR